MANRPLFPPAPDELFGELFHDVQLSGLFPDSKTFADAVPLTDPAQIRRQYEREKTTAGFSLLAFVQQHFSLPEPVRTDYVSDLTQRVSDHIDRLWNRLARPADVPVPAGTAPAGALSAGDESGSSRVPLPHPYVVPGGRFREIFYWDSYFTMLGLRESGRLDLIRGMVANFAYLLDRFGFIPNGNRTYFLTRSQPPFFALMVRLLVDIDGPDVLVRYLPQLEREYEFWMSGAAELPDCRPDEPLPAIRRVVRLPDGAVLNRYWDGTPKARPEAYPKEMAWAEAGKALAVSSGTLFVHLRAACESGWDFSSRWQTNPAQIATTRAADLVPFDLNGLLYELEQTLADGYRRAKQPDRARWAAEQAESRKALVQRVFWHDGAQFFTDYDRLTHRLTDRLTAAAVLPLFVGIATPAQAEAVHRRLRDDFLQPGGLVTTLIESGQQWDWPNGWAPLQWLAYVGLRRYGFTDTAELIRTRWLALNDAVYRETGKLMEKYNVVDTSRPGGGGNYPNQDGFGWTNGVYRAFQP